MIREEAKLTVSQCINSDWCRGYNEAVSVLFNDFESRTCENCKYLQPDEWCKELNCHIDVDMGLDAKDFGCNMFEDKNK